MLPESTTTPLPPSAELAPEPAAIRPASHLAEQFVRYVLVGGLAFLVDFGLYALLERVLEVHYQSAAVVGFMAGVATNYLLSIFWVFNKRSAASVWMEFVVFLIVGIVGMALNAAMLWALIDQATLDSLAAKVVAAGVVLVWNFSARKILLFS